MTSLPEPRIQAWERPVSVDTQMQQLVNILTGALGIVLVTLLTWVVLVVVR
jgi:hypothetical protein